MFFQKNKALLTDKEIHDNDRDDNNDINKNNNNYINHDNHNNKVQRLTLRSEGFLQKMLNI